MRVTWDPFHPQFCFQIALEGLVRLSPGLRDLPLATWPLGLGRTGAHFSVPCIRGFSALEADKESSKCNSPTENPVAARPRGRRAEEREASQGSTQPTFGVGGNSHG
jgi:hypothetical protein